jgi:hypothetical protein
MYWRTEMTATTAERVRTIRAEEDIHGVRTGKIVAIDASGTVTVDFHGNRRGPLPAKITESVRERLEGCHAPQTAEVLLVFEAGDPLKPVIFDLLRQGLTPLEPASIETETGNPDREILIDAAAFDFSAKERIVLRCGKASITLTKAGKIIIRGAYLLNRSSGVNLIKGGSVRIN